MDRHDRTAQHVALPTAAATAYFKVTGLQADGRLDERTRHVLCDVARALSALVPIYTHQPVWEMPRPIPPGHLVGATFEHGAHSLTLHDGTELRQLTVQRGDLDRAIAILKERGFERRPGQRVTG